jgi:hypothetical protein
MNLGRQRRSDYERQEEYDELMWTTPIPIRNFNDEDFVQNINAKLKKHHEQDFVAGNNNTSINVLLFIQ